MKIPSPHLKISVGKHKAFSYFFLVLGYLLIIFIFYPGLFLNFSNMVPFGSHGDVLNILGIIDHAVNTSLTKLFDYHFPTLYPESYVLAKTHPIFGISIFFKFFHVIGLNLEQSTNLYIILAFIIGALGCFLLIKEFTHNNYLAFVFSALYIVHRKNSVYFHWLNFHTHFYIPFVFYFLIRYSKTKKEKYLFLFSVFAFLQFLSSIYYGVHLWVFLIPCIIVLALFYKIFSVKETAKILFGLCLGFLLILVIFYPFINKTDLVPNRSDPVVLNTKDLFAHSKLFDLFLEPLKGSENIGDLYFPGYLVIFSVLFYVASLIGQQKKRYIVFVVFAFFVFLMTYLTYVNLLILDYVFLIFLSGILILFLFSWKNLNKWERIFLFTFSFFMILLFQFVHINFLDSVYPYKFLQSFPPFNGFRAVLRILPILFPFLIVFAALGGNRFLQSFKYLTKNKIIVISSFMLLLMMVENFPYRHPLQETQIMQALPKQEAKVYEMLPKKKDKVLLEIPFYSPLLVSNSRYMLNWKLHQNYLLNGKVSIEPRGYFFDLLHIIGDRQELFPNEAMLKDLIQKYSVTHVILHWDLLIAYQKDDKAQGKMERRIKEINQYGRIIYRDNSHTLLEIKEYIPTNHLVRTFSYFHLKNNVINIKLNRPFKGLIRVLLNNRLIHLRELDNWGFFLNLSQYDLNNSGNRVEIIFDEPISLKDISFVPVKKQRKK